MKHLFLFLTVFVFQSLSIAQTNNWKTLQNSRYSIEYPSSWEADTSGHMGLAFVVYSIATSDKDEFRENVNFIFEDVSQHQLTLDQYSQLSENQLKKMITDFRMVSSTRTELNGRTCRRVVFSGRQGVYQLKYLQYYMIVGNNALVLTFTAEIAEFDKFKSTANRILESFTLK